MKYICIFIFLFIFLTSAKNSNRTTVFIDYDKELKQIKEDLKKADEMNKLFQEATSTDKQLRLIKKKIKKDARQNNIRQD